MMSEWNRDSTGLRPAAPMPATTDWYPASVDPVRIGEYEARYWSEEQQGYGRVFRLRWTGARWQFPGRLAFRSSFGVSRRDQWRGLKASEAA